MIVGLNQYNTEMKMHNHSSKILLLTIILTILSLYSWGCVPKKQVDFTVQNIQWKPQNPLEGDFVTFSITIANIGSADSLALNPIDITLYIDGKNFAVNNVPPMSAGKSETVVLSSEWQAVSKCHEIKVIVNGNDKVKEPDKDNNTKAKELCVENRLLWKQILIDSSKIYSSPALNKGNIFVASGNNVLYCLNSESGNLVWEKSVGVDFHNSSMDTLFSSPVVSEGKVYIHAYDRDNKGQLNAYLLCLSADKGNLLWKQLVFTWPSSFDSLPYSGSSPAIYNGKVYLISEIYFYCFNATNGKLVWKYKTNSPIDSSPAFYQGKVYTSLQGSDYLGCFDAESGKLLWKHRTGETLSTQSYILANNGKLYVCPAADVIYCLNVENGDLLWEKDISSIADAGSPLYTPPEIYNNKLYIGLRNNALFCLNANDGELLWQCKTMSDKYKVNDPPSSPVEVNNGKLYFGSSLGTLYCIDADKGTLLWSYKTQKTIWSKPLIYQGKVYFGANSYVYCISAYSN